MRTLFINSLLIIIAFVQKIKSFSEFKVFKLENENLLVFNQKGIYIYDTNLQINYYKYYENLVPPISVSVADLQKISFFRSNFHLFFTLKNKIYVFFINKSKFISYDINSDNCQTSFIESRYSNRELIFTIQCINAYNELDIKLYCFLPENEIIYYTNINYILKLDNKNMIRILVVRNQLSKQQYYHALLNL